VKLKFSLSTCLAKDLFVKNPVFQGKCFIELITPYQNLYIYFYKSFYIFYINNNNFVCFAKKLIITSYDLNQTRSSGVYESRTNKFKYEQGSLMLTEVLPVDGFVYGLWTVFLDANDATFT